MPNGLNVWCHIGNQIVIMASCTPNLALALQFAFPIEFILTTAALPCVRPVRLLLPGGRALYSYGQQWWTCRWTTGDRIGPVARYSAADGRSGPRKYSA